MTQQAHAKRHSFFGTRPSQTSLVSTPLFKLMPNFMKPFHCLIIVLALSISHGSFGQIVTETNYNTQNFRSENGYVAGVGIISTSQPTSIRWLGNDPYDALTDRGETDLIALVNGYTPIPPLSNNSLLQGGVGVISTNPILPGTNNVQISKTFSSSTTAFENPTVSLFVEWSIIASSVSVYTNSDTFSFDLRDSGNSVSLLTMQMTPGINIQSNSYTLQTVVGSTTNAPIIDLGYGSLFQMQVDLTGSTFNLASLTRINPSTRAVITNFNNLASGNLASGATALDFATIGIDWELASGDTTDPGSNYIVVNQIGVTTAGTVIPEPGTWAASLILLGIGAGYLHRRKSRRLVPSKG